MCCKNFCNECHLEVSFFETSSIFFLFFKKKGSLGIEQGFFLPCFVFFGSFWFSFNFQIFWFFFSMFSDYRRDTMCRNLFIVFFLMFSSYESDTMCMNFFWSLHCVFFQQRNTKCKNKNWVFFQYIYFL